MDKAPFDSMARTDNDMPARYVIDDGIPVHGARYVAGGAGRGAHARIQARLRHRWFPAGVAGKPEVRGATWQRRRVQRRFLAGRIPQALPVRPGRTALESRFPVQRPGATGAGPSFMSSLQLRPGRLTLPDLRRIWSERADARGRSGRQAGGRRRRRDRRAGHSRGAHRLWRQHGLRPAGAHAHRQRAAERIAARAGALAQRRHGRVARRCGRAPGHRPQGGVAGLRSLRHPLGGDRVAGRHQQRRHRAVHSRTGIGRRVGRPGAARASVRRADRRRRSAHQRRHRARRAGAGAGRIAADRPGAQGRAWRCSTARRCRPRWRSPGCSPPSGPCPPRSSPAR